MITSRNLCIKPPLCCSITRSLYYARYTKSGNHASILFMRSFRKV